MNNPLNRDEEEQWLRAEQSAAEYPDDSKCPPELRQRLNKLYQGIECLESERRYPVTDMWESEEEARANREESAGRAELNKEE